MINIYRVHSLTCVTRQIIDSCMRGAADGRVVFITPESSKASVERIVMDSLSDIRGQENGSVSAGDDISVDSAFVDGDVLSFIRLAVRMLEMCGVRSSSSSDKIIMRNAIYRILADHHKEFRTFGKFIGRFEYVDGITDLLGDFRRYNIDDDMIAKAYELAEDAGDDGVYSDKLHDFKLLSLYLDELGKQYDIRLTSDPISDAVRLLTRIAQDRSLFENGRYRELRRFLKTKFAVTGFGNVRMLTPQETELIRLMSSLGSDISFYPIWPSHDIREEGRDTVYSNAGAFVDSLSDNIPDVFIHDFKEENTGDTPSAELALAVSDYALRISRKDQVRTSDIVAVSIEGMDDSVGYISNEIIRLTREEGYRYKDIRIVCASEDIKNGLKGIMERFGLDMFVDRKIVINNTPVFRYISALADLPIRDFELNDVLRILRTGLASVPLQDVDLLENYCIKFNITRGSRIFDRDYYTGGGDYPDMIYRNGQSVPVSKYLWESVIERALVPIREIAVAISNEPLLSGKARLMAEHTDSLADTIRSMAKELSERGDNDRASALVRGYSEVMSLLVQLMTPMNDVKADQQVFSSLIRIDMRNKVQGTIPLMVDSVEILSPEQAYITPCKVLFLVGAQADNFPYGKVSEGLLSTGELMRFSRDSGVELPDKVQSRNRSDFIASALMFGTASDKIYILNDEAKLETAQSSAYKHFKSYSSTVLINCFRTMMYGQAVEKRHAFKDTRISADIMDRILSEPMRVSVSSLETYNTCHFRYMLKYMLGIKERDNGTTIKSNVMGTIIHHMFEVALKDIVKAKTTPEALTEYASRLRDDPEALGKISEESFISYCDFSPNPYEKTAEFSVNPGRKARRLFEYVLPVILEEAGSAGYVPSDFEMSIGEIEPPLSIGTTTGKKFDFVGYIDRIDTDPDTGKARIIDYKTGQKKIDLKKTLGGIQTQLFAYSNAVRATGVDVSDVGYFEIGMKADKDKDFSLAPQLAKLEQDGFEDVSSYVDWRIRRSCEEIAEGVSDALVNSLSGKGRNSACGYCPYSGVCGNDPYAPSCRVEGTVRDAVNPDHVKKEEYIHEMNLRREQDDGTVR